MLYVIHIQGADGVENISASFRSPVRALDLLSKYDHVGARIHMDVFTNNNFILPRYTVDAEQVYAVLADAAHKEA